MARVEMNAAQGMGTPARAARGHIGGIVRRVDELGRIVIPVEIRRRHGIDVHDPLEISVRGDTILLSKPRNECVFCGSTRALAEFRDRMVCAECRTGLAADVVSAARR
jgi:AbrB family transcriptional regulator, transcriptional pleiotropic regulator of transition state genes